ncbi:hypothetical protein ABZV24_30535 [Streptomyces sp. NPDC005251]|uniref:hypothetical protein n=1 Tax=Streptomyces sp. NPDC005251 TaxID=3157166 RepID=UPI0033BE623F
MTTVVTSGVFPSTKVRQELGVFSFGSAQEAWRDEGGIGRLVHDDFVVDQYPYLDKGFNKTAAP